MLFGTKQQLLVYALLEILLMVLLLGAPSISWCCNHYTLCFPRDGTVLLGGCTFNNHSTVVSTEVYQTIRFCRKKQYLLLDWPKEVRKSFSSHEWYLDFLPQSHRMVSRFTCSMLVIQPQTRLFFPSFFICGWKYAWPLGYVIGKDRLLILLTLHIFGVLSEILHRLSGDRHNFESDLLFHI